MKKKSLIYQNPVLLLMSTVGINMYMFASTAQAEPNLHGYVMQVQMTPAICALDSTRQKQRKCLEGYSLTITGLLPETSSSSCETASLAILPPLQARVVARVMPDDNARTQLWRSVGGCVPMPANQYFRTIINYAERLKIPNELTNGSNKNIQKSELTQSFTRLNPKLPSNGIRFICQSTRSYAVLTELQVCYQVNGNYKQCANHVVSNCPSEFMIKGSY